MIGTFAVTDIFLWLYFLYFILAIFISCFIPGNLIFRKVKLDSFSQIVLSLVLGMALWGYQGYILGYLDMRFGTYIYLAICILLWIMPHVKSKIPVIGIKIKKDTILLVALLALGSFVQIITIWSSGVHTLQGLYFCCGVDSVYHLAITNELVKQFPPLEPGTHNTIVTNYHYFSNMIVAEWVRVFKLPLTATYMQYATVLLSIAMGAVAITFGRVAGLDKRIISWLLFFLYFSGSALYLTLFFLRQTFNVESIVLHDATILWASPPRVYGIILFLAGLTVLHLWLKKRSIYLAVICGMLFGCLISIKVYFGLFVLAGFAILNLYFLWKRDFKAIVPSLITLIISLCLYLPVNQDSGGLFFSGIWRFDNFIVSAPLELREWELAKATYWAEQNWLRVLQYTLMYIVLYYVTVFGTLLFGLFQTHASLRLLRKEIHIFLASGILISLGAGSFFLQHTGGSNTSQFIITVIAIISLYTALAVSFWTTKIKNTYVYILLVGIIILLTIPRAVFDTYKNISNVANGKGYTFTNDDLAASAFLRDAPEGTILTPLYDCLYIRLLTEKQLYVCNDASAVADHKVVRGIERINISKVINANMQSASTISLMKREGIKYVYIRREKDNKEKYLLPKIYENETVVILQVP